MLSTVFIVKYSHYHSNAKKGKKVYNVKETENFL